MSQYENRAELLVNGDLILPSLLADIRAAQSTVHISIFLWFRDPIGEELADALLERVRAGVTVRVLLNIQKKIAVFDERYSIHGSTNGNFRSLEDDKDFELVVLVDDEPFAKHVLEIVRDVDIQHSHRVTQQDVTQGLSGFRLRHRDPRTLYLYSQRVL